MSSSFAFHCKFCGVIALFALMLCANLASSQETTFKAQSNLVSVPTLVEGADGKVIYGLHRSDFVIEDDGV